LRHFIKEHILVLLYSSVLLLLSYGIVRVSGIQHLGKILIFSVSLYGSYFLLKYAVYNKKKLNFQFPSKISPNPTQLKKLAQGLSFLILAFILLHLILLKGSPAILAMSKTTAVEVAQIRTHIAEVNSTLIAYISSFIIRGFLPFLIIYFLINKNYIIYVTLLVAGVFYAFSLMQKSFVILMLLPSFIYFIITFRYWISALHLLLMTGSVIGLSFIANPDLTVEEHPTPQAEEYTKFERILIGLNRRITIVPGEMVVKWFEIIPLQKPFLRGDGYRLVAKFKGTRFREYAKELYPLIKPKNASIGQTGTVNTASFMYDYANFGKVGLVFSGIILSLLFLLIDTIFQSSFAFKFSLNSVPILMLSSTALSTGLLSGGWLILIGMFFLFKPILKTS
jgi:hypothetical protein